MGVGLFGFRFMQGVLSPSPIAENFAFSPSLAEGVRGWVSLEVSKSPASLKSQNLQSKEKTDSSKVDIAKAKFSIANLANAKSNNENFASAKSTHPQTPSAREGALRSVATLSNEGASFWAYSKREGALIANTTTNICHTERSEVSLKNIDCHAKSNDFLKKLRFCLFFSQ
ncbi:hypothetical protein [Helicobacter sp. T3_23-1059]